MKIVFLFIFFGSLLQGEIVEMFSFHEIEKYLEPGLLILLDIDNTLLEPAQEYGNDQWFRHRFNHHHRTLQNQDEALENTIFEWERAQSLTKVKLVEQETSSLVKKLQDQKYVVMGVTARGTGMTTITSRQLKSLSLDLSLTAPSQNSYAFVQKNLPVVFQKGVLFANGLSKGVALFQFLKHVDFYPEKILLVDDKLSHLQDVEQACLEKEVPFLGLRYGFLDEKVKNFKSDWADIQHQAFPLFLSDEEAARSAL